MQTEAAAKAISMKQPEDDDPVGHDGVGEKRAALERSRMIGSRLRALYDHVTKEPVPEDFAQLLASLDAPKKPREPLS